MRIRSKASGIQPPRGRASTRSANSLRLRATLLLLVAAGLLMVAAIVSVGSATGGRGAPRADERIGNVFDRGERPSRPVTRGGSRELVSERTARSRTYRNANGSLVAKIFAEPIHYRDGRGRWRLIRNALQRDGAKITNSAGPYRLALPGDLRDAVQVREGQAALSFELAGGEGGARVAGNRVRYDDALPGVDALYEAGSDSLKETLILERPDAQSVLRFELRPNANVRPQLKPDGAVDFVHRSGRVAFSFAPPFMVDSSGQSGALSRDIAVSLRRQGSAYVLTLRPDRQWLQATERVYPVRLDPTISFSRTQACTIASGSPNSSRTGLWVGQYYGNRERALIQFDVASRIPRQAEILDARLGLFHNYRENSSVTPVTVHRVGRAWFDWRGCRATWNQAALGSPWNGGVFAPSTTATKNIGPEGLNRYVEWHPTEDVRAWMDAPTDIYGFLLKASPETVSNYLSFLDSGSKPPYLAVTYEPRVGQLDRYRFDGEPLPDTTGQESEPESPPLRFDVNTANGNLLLRERDVHFAATGIDIEFERFYNNLDPNTTPIGSGWTSDSPVDIRLQQFGDLSVAYYGPSGYAKWFRRNPDGTFRSPQGLYADLTRNPDGTYRLEDHEHNLTYAFNRDGLMTARTDDGASEIFSYAQGRLAAITDPDGRQTTFSYDAGGFLSKITEPGGAEHVYTHDERGNLASYTDPNGNRSTMTYDSALNLIRVVDRDGRESRFSYDSDNRVTSITKVTDPSTGAGPTTTYTYPNDGYTIATAPDGRESRYMRDTQSIGRRVDAGASPPTVTVSGTLPYQDTKTLVADTSYTLTVNGQDADGIKEISVHVNGSLEADTSNQPCSGTSCSLTWTMESEELLDPGEALIEYTVLDTHGNEFSQVIVVTVPRWSLEPWDDTSHLDQPCPDPVAPDGSGASCLESGGQASVAAAPNATYSRHLSDTDVYGITWAGRLTEIWGAWQWNRDINLNGSVAHIWQSAQYLTGNALRYDMRMRLYRGDNHKLVDEWREILPSRSTFSKGHEPMTSRFPRGRAGHEYHLHWRVYFRASGRPNPNHPSGLFHTPLSASDKWVCHYDADEQVVCFFPE